MWILVGMCLDLVSLFRMTFSLTNPPQTLLGLFNWLIKGECLSRVLRTTGAQTLVTETVIMSYLQRT